MNNNDLTKKIGKRILSEANDLKRTIKALAKDIDFDEKNLEKIINGKCNIEDSYKIINKMGDVYPIDISDLFLLKDDTTNGVKFMRAKDSTNSSRVFCRINRNGERTPYYEYRDTAMSILSPYKPEWIKELRIVDNNDPNNPDVIFNNGHFMHQITFFVGPVNFYWEVNGKKYCKEMNTGDSNYITPFWPHSFTNRNSDEEAYILAITFGAEVRRAQKELYALGAKSQNYLIQYRNHQKAIKQLIYQHMCNENYTYEHLAKLLKDKSIDIDINDIKDGSMNISFESLKIIAELLNIEPYDLLLPEYNPSEEVVIKVSEDKNKYYYPSEKEVCYKIEALARTSKMPLLKGFSLEVISKKISNNLITSLHTYIYNYGSSEIIVYWEDEGVSYQEKIQSNDSLYIQPFINHGFSCSGKNGKLFIVRVSGSINLATQRELSYMSNINRAYNEKKPWFN